MPPRIWIDQPPNDDWPKRTDDTFETRRARREQAAPPAPPRTTIRGEGHVRLPRPDGGTP